VTNMANRPQNRSDASLVNIQAAFERLEEAIHPAMSHFSVPLLYMT
jgi:hypothetical protein